MFRLFLTTTLLTVVTASGAQEPLPERLVDTGLYAPGSNRIAADVLPFSPQYPLWSDGASKRRWLYIPPGRTIDAADPDAWVFPPGTRAWKEFSFARPIETRFIERLQDGSWRFAAYVWSEDGRDARLAPEAGLAFHAAADAPGGRYPIPSREDCLACHEGGAGPLLGLNALQLSPDRDPGAPHAEALQPEFADLYRLNELGLMMNLSATLLEHPPRIAATSATARAALGYMHSNCGICHNDRGPLSDMDFNLLQSALDTRRAPARTLATTVLRMSDSVAPGVDRRLVPGRPELSALFFRIRSRNLVSQMPPLARRIPDAQAIALIENWIQNDLPFGEEIR